jgi:NadR type nicotinamide-nucleotide adenylyltransferase
MPDKTVYRISITGPESSGKTTLAQALAARFQTLWVPEYARAYLETLARPYVFEDLEEIAKGQIAWEDESAREANKLLFCDTDLLVLKVWSEYKYGRCAPFILEALAARPYDLYLLCRPDIPWVPDPLRENPGEREELYNIYLSELRSMNARFLELNGPLADRLERAQQACSSAFGGKEILF